MEHQLRRLWAAGRLIRAPLRRGRSVLWSAMAARRIAPKFTTDRGCRPTKTTRNGPDPVPLCAQDRDLLTFGE
jgi:hypothetical protein